MQGIGRNIEEALLIIHTIIIIIIARTQNIYIRIAPRMNIACN